MANRDVAVSLCGVVVGVIIAAASTSFVSGDSFAASVRFHEAPDAADYSRRKIDGRNLPMNPEAPMIHSTVKYPSSSSSSMTGLAAMASCDAVRATVARLQRAFNMILPDTLRNTDMRQRMAAEFDTALSDCTLPISSSSPAAARSSSVPTVNNNCARFPRGTIRYTQCTIEESVGQTYP